MEALRESVEAAEGASTTAIRAAEAKKEAAMRKAKATYDAAIKKANDAFDADMVDSGSPALSARTKLLEAEDALDKHLDMMENEIGVKLGWLQPEKTSGGRMRL